MKQCNCKNTVGAGPQTHLPTCPSYDPLNQPTEKVPMTHREAAVEEAAKAKHLGTEAMLDAARPHERAAFREEMLSEETVEAGAKRHCEECGESWVEIEEEGREECREVAKPILRAAFESIEGSDK